MPDAPALLFPSHQHSPAMQHSSHRRLLAIENQSAAVGTIDAIVVPTSRSHANLGEAVRLSSLLKVPLLALCSRDAQAADLVDWVADFAPDVNLVAVDIPTEDLHPALNLKSAELMASTSFHRTSDTSLKHNMALLIAKAANWTSIMFLDDDIEIADPDDILRAAALLDSYDVVSLQIDGFPDNSVVCHAIRRTGGRQDTFIGCGAMVVRVDAQMSLFPNIYNEDWFFLLDPEGLRPIALSGSASQSPYDPFADPNRAVQEEFGDVLAEGLFAKLDNGGEIVAADAAYWRSFINHRGNLIEEVLDLVRQMEVGKDRTHMLASLHASRQSLAKITPELCVDYLNVWQWDIERWHEQLKLIRSHDTIEDALAEIQLFTVKISNGIRTVEMSPAS